MKDTKGLMQKLADGADLSEETLPWVPVIELAGDRRVLIERHGGVTEYTNERICIRVAYGQVAVCGCGLELSRMTREQLVLASRTASVQLHRRGK